MQKQWNHFIACDKEYVNSDIVIFGAPFDGTVSYRPGTRFASNAIRNESYGIETYSPYLDKDLEDVNVFDAGDLELCFGNPAKTIQQIEDFTTSLIKHNKIPVMIGGEHLVSLGSIRTFAKQYKELCIIHFDAHADLRADYLGEELSHATVMRRVWDIVGDDRIFQFGIRSGTKEEFSWGKTHVYTNKFDFCNLTSIAEKIGNRPVYFTLDLDVLDPSIFSGTGTPEAGGVGFSELLKACMNVCKLNIVGLDITELSPNYDTSGTSTIVACKILRELLLSI